MLFWILLPCIASHSYSKGTRQCEAHCHLLNKVLSNSHNTQRRALRKVEHYKLPLTKISRTRMQRVWTWSFLFFFLLYPGIASGFCLLIFEMHVFIQCTALDDSNECSLQNLDAITQERTTSRQSWTKNRSARRLMLPHHSDAYPDVSTATHKSLWQLPAFRKYLHINGSTYIHIFASILLCAGIIGA